MSIEFPQDNRQKRIRARVTLRNTNEHVLRDKKMEVWEGAPVGDWTEVNGVRIALRRVTGKFEGILPDIEDIPA